MISIALGKIAVTTAGTPVAITLTAAQTAQLDGNRCSRLEAWPDPADTGTVYVKQNGVTLAALPHPTNVANPWSTHASEERNQIQPLVYSIDAATNGEGPFVTLWVE